MSDNFVSLFAKYKNKIITVKMNDRKTIKGMLMEYDKIMNMTLDGAKDVSSENPLILGRTLIKGNSITAISFPIESK
jgi:small nuclear ribonucleoprotein (snRNP)-like protein